MKGSYNFLGVDEAFTPWVFMVRSSSEDLLQKIPEIAGKAKEAAKRAGIDPGQIDDLIVIFDREGYSAELYRFLDGRDRDDKRRRAIFISWAKYADKWVNDIAADKLNKSVLVSYDIQEAEEVKYFETERAMNKYGKIRAIVIESGTNRKRAAIYTNGGEEEIDSEIVDEYETPIGIRNIRFDADKGFFLNGRHVVLKGVCGHPDHAGLGSALPDGMHEFRLNKLKEMGVNAVRSQHCCSTSEWLDACDRLGIMVLDEHRLFGSAAETLDELESMVVRDRNHPSIILWSLGNEEFVQSSDVGARIAKTMQRLVKKLDPTRLTTFGANNDGTETGINSVVDVRGWNYMYHGGVDEYHKRNPNQPIIILEEASTLCTRGEYVDDSDKCYVSAYDEHPPDRGTNVWMSAEEWWTYFVARPYLAGGFVWTGFDYAGEPTPYWKWPCVGSHFGVMDYCGFPKDNYYYYQS